MPYPKKHASHAARQAAYHKRQEKARREQLQAKGLLALPAIPTIPGYPRWRQALAHAESLLDMVATEMEDYANERSEEWNETDRADQFRENIDAITGIRDQLSELDVRSVI